MLFVRSIVQLRFLNQNGNGDPWIKRRVQKRMLWLHCKYSFVFSFLVHSFCRSFVFVFLGILTVNLTKKGFWRAGQHKIYVITIPMLLSVFISCFSGSQWEQSGNPNGKPMHNLTWWSWRWFCCLVSKLLWGKTLENYTGLSPDLRTLFLVKWWLWHCASSFERSSS